MTHATDGLTYGVPFAHYDRDMCSWRMSPVISITGSALYSATWPKTGMTRRGIAYPLVIPSGPYTNAKGYSLLPTPMARGASREMSMLRQGGAGLGDVILDTNGRDYRRTLHRWTRLSGQPQPAARTNDRGHVVVNPEFIEWMMAVPVGYVTTLVRRTQANRLLGNSVVWRQALWAYTEIARAGRVIEHARHASVSISGG